MSVGLDSISAVDLVQTLGQRLGTELEPTALFDYPTIGSLTKYLKEQMEPSTTHEAHLPDEYSSDDEVTRAPISLYDLYSELKQDKTYESFVPPVAAKSARRAVVLFAFAGSGSRYIL